jgi:hypothetical protein
MYESQAATEIVHVGILAPAPADNLMNSETYSLERVKVIPASSLHPAPTDAQ